MMSTLLSPKKVNVPQTAKEQELEIEELTKTNFNLKLRVFYLEEALRKGKSGDVQSSVDLKLQIDQYSKELEEKSKLLLKARGIIETLQSDLELARAAQDIKRTLEDDEAMKSGLDQQRRAERRIEDLELKLRQLHQADVSLRADNETQARQMQDITREAEEHRRQLEEQLQRVSSELAEVRHTWSTREQELLQDVTHSLNHRRQAEAELALRTAELSQLTESADKRSERERDLMAKLDARNALLTTLCKRLSDMFPDQAPTADVVSRFDVFADGITRVAAQLTKAKTSFEAVTVRNEQYCAAQIADLNERVSSKIRQLENAEGQLHALKAQTERQRQENLALRNAISSDVEKHALQRERARAEELELRLRNVQQQAEYSLRNERDSQTRLIQDVSREAIEHRKQLEADLQRTGSELAELKRSSSDRERDLTADVEARTVLLHSMAKRLGEAFPESAPTADLVYSKFEVFADAMMRVASMVGRVKSTFESHAARHELYCKEQLDNFNERLSQRVRQLESAESAQTRLHSQVEELRRDNMQLQRGSLTTNTEQMQIVRERDDAVQRVTELSSLVQNMRDRLLEMEDIGSRAGEALDKRQQDQKITERLSESNRLLVLEVEDRKMMLERIQKHYKQLQREHAHLLADADSLRRRNLQLEQQAASGHRNEQREDALEASKQLQVMLSRECDKVMLTDRKRRDQRETKIITSSTEQLRVETPIRTSQSSARMAAIQQDLRSHLDQASAVGSASARR